MRTTRRNDDADGFSSLDERRHTGARRAGGTPTLAGAGRVQAEARRCPGRHPRLRDAPGGRRPPGPGASHRLVLLGKRTQRSEARGDLPSLFGTPGEAGPGQYAADRPRRQAVPRPRGVLLGPAPGGVLRAPRGHRPLRPDPRDQAGDLRDLVDSPGHAEGRRRRRVSRQAQPQAPPPARPEPGRSRQCGRLDDPRARRSGSQQRDDPGASTRPPGRPSRSTRASTRTATST